MTCHIILCWMPKAYERGRIQTCETTLVAVDISRVWRSLPVLCDIRFFIAPIIMKNVLQGNVAETLNRKITSEEAAFNPFTLSVERPESSDPIALLELIDEGAYEEQVVSVYRDIMGLVIEDVAEVLETTLPEESPTVAEKNAESAKEESEKGLLKNVARLLRNVRG